MRSNPTYGPKKSLLHKMTSNISNNFPILVMVHKIEKPECLEKVSLSMGMKDRCQNGGSRPIKNVHAISLYTSAPSWFSPLLLLHLAKNRPKKLLRKSENSCGHF